MDFLKTVGGKVVGAMGGVAVVVAAIALWRMDSATWQSLGRFTGNALGWLAVVALWPWVSFAIIRRVAKAESNLAGGVLVVVYTALEAGLLVYLFGLPQGATGWTFAGVGVLLAAAYNLLICDWIAEKLD